MKIQPFDNDSFRVDSAKPVLRSRLKRLFFDRPFLKISSAEKFNESAEFEVGTIGLDKMVQNYMEDGNEKPSSKLGRKRCNCFNGSSNNDSSDDEFDEFENNLIDSAEMLKGLVQCASKGERNLLADASKIMEKNKACKKRDDMRQIVTVGLVAMGYDASICKSRWEKCQSYPSGRYEYIDVVIGSERLIVDVEFKAEFDIARPTSSYKAIFQSLPRLFVGAADRLYQIVGVVSEAAKLSLKKKGMPLPPWRKADYMRAKWLSSYTRITPTIPVGAMETEMVIDAGVMGLDADVLATKNEVVQAVETKAEEFESEYDFALLFKEEAEVVVDEMAASAGKVVSAWQPPEFKPKSCDKGGAKVVVTGLACLLREKP